MSVPPPPRIRFTLDATESRRLRDQLYAAAGVRAYPIVAASFALNILQPLLQFWEHGWHAPFAWALLSIDLIGFISIGLIVLRTRHTIAPALRSAVATDVTFDDSKLQISRTGSGTTVVNVVAYSNIRQISTLPDAFSLTTGIAPILVIPKRAIADGGAEFMRFFEDRLVGKRMLRRSTSTATTIVNTASR